MPYFIYLNPCFPKTQHTLCIRSSLCLHLRLSFPFSLCLYQCLAFLVAGCLHVHSNEEMDNWTDVSLGPALISAATCSSHQQEPLLDIANSLLKQHGSYMSMWMKRFKVWIRNHFSKSILKFKINCYLGPFQCH